MHIFFILLSSEALLVWRYQSFDCSRCLESCMLVPGAERERPCHSPASLLGTYHSYHLTRIPHRKTWFSDPLDTRLGTALQCHCCDKTDTHGGSFHMLIVSWKYRYRSLNTPAKFEVCEDHSSTRDKIGSSLERSSVQSRDLHRYSHGVRLQSDLWG